MSPFDELMAQHQQQLQRERQLLRLASARGCTASSSKSSEDTSKIPPIPPPAPALTGGHAKIEDIPLGNKNSCILFLFDGISKRFFYFS